MIASRVGAGLGLLVVGIAVAVAAFDGPAAEGAQQPRRRSGARRSWRASAGPPR